MNNLGSADYEVVKPQSERARPRRLDWLKNEFTGIGFLLPFLIVFGVFYIWPLLRGTWISFHSWSIMGMVKYVGLDNYLRTLQNKDFYSYLWHSVYFVILSTPLLIIIGLLLAVLVNCRFRGRTIVRAIIFSPYVLSVSVVAYIWLEMLDAKRGIINVILNTLGFPREINWLTDPNLAWWAIVLTSIWWYVGFVMILYLAGLQEISPELYEAASIDGANSIKKFLHITLPSLSSVTRVQIFFQVIAGLKLFGQVQIMTNGGPGDATRTVVQHIYITGFRKDFFGEAAAQSIIFCLFMLLVSVLQYKFVNKRH